jgi:hypothetical protein
MPVDIQITGLTVQQMQDIRDAFIATHGPVPEGMTPARYVRLCLFRFIKNVVKGWKRDTQEAVIRAQNAQVEADFQEDIA